jgi:hypothetical protein
MGARHVARYTGLSVDEQEAALRELLDTSVDADGARFLSIEGDAYSVKRWSEKAGKESQRLGNRARASRSRHKKSTVLVTPASRKPSRSRHATVTPSVTPPSQNSHATRIAREEELETTSSTSGSIEPPVEAPAAPPADAVPWQDQVREATRALRKRSLSSLSVVERSIVAQYHCLEVANCTKTEANNKAQATKVAAALASMGRSKGYSDMNVGAYVTYIRRVFEQREKTPFYDPWLIKAVVEFDAVA